MKGIKKIAAFALTLAMVALAATGCSKPAGGGGETQKTKTEIADNGLAAPDGIETSAADGNVTVTWDAVDGALKYDVYGAGVHAVTRDTSYTFNSLAPGEYNVAIRAFGGSRSSEASKVTFVVAETGAVETTAVDVPELKVESKATSKSDSKTDSKKAESTTKTDKAKASTGTGNTDSDKNDGNGNTSTDNNNNANTVNNGNDTNTGGGNTATTPTNPTPDPNAGKTYVPKKEIWHETTFKNVERQAWEIVGDEIWEECMKCAFATQSHDEMREHMKATGHSYRVVSRYVYGWVTKVDKVVDQEGWLETIPEHWE